MEEGGELAVLKDELAVYYKSDKQKPETKSCIVSTNYREQINS